MSKVSEINTITPQFVQVGSNATLWNATNSAYQPIDLREGKVEYYVDKLKELNPQANTLRLFFNSNSFDENGDLPPLYAELIEVAASKGFNFVFTYASAQTRHADLKGVPLALINEAPSEVSSGEVYTALETYFVDNRLTAFGELADWIDARPEVKNAVYGLEMANEPAAYNMAARDGVDLTEKDSVGISYSKNDFVQLYVDHAGRFADFVKSYTGGDGTQIFADSKVLIGGWNFGSRIDRFVKESWDGQTAADHLRAAVGPDLVWSLQFFLNSVTDGPNSGPGGLSWPSTQAGIEATFAEYFAPILQDDVIITATAIDSHIESLAGGLGPNYALASSLEWLAENGVGYGVFDAYGPDAFFDLAGNGDNFRVVIKNQFALAHIMNGMSLADSPGENAGADNIDVVPFVVKRMQNQRYEADYFEPVSGYTQNADGTVFVGEAFGYGGNDTLTGTDTSNDFLYGGEGDDVLSGGGNDDFLFGQQGNDRLVGGTGINHLYGGSGNDHLVSGSGFDQMNGGTGADVFQISGAAGDIIVDFSITEDLLDLSAVDLSGITNFDALMGYMRDADLISEGVISNIATGDNTSFTTNDTPVEAVAIELPDGTVSYLYGVRTSDLTSSILKENYFADGKVDGTAGDDIISTSHTDESGDVLTFNKRPHEIYGYGGNDIINLAKGRGVNVYGGADDDFVRLIAVSGRIYGEEGNDTLLAGSKSVVLDGGAGDDILVGNLAYGARQILTGGDGVDSFAFKAPSLSRMGRAEITDFDVATETLVIAGSVVDVLNPGPDYTVAASEAGDLVITFGDDDTITFLGVSYEDYF
ncbi:calcium-binding protein [Palleronia caenipelagi]|uniref:Calcium-binding protein n=1 Tax=Palleronia caenipelagi TaxID=2489174 RepID=A0A547PJ78_9RHOB|nr:calcium-binding protein [Palleronia caenipelagi]TRD14104.1 calcium-binding protein [Palleronia caenipelagi]